MVMLAMSANERRRLGRQEELISNLTAKFCKEYGGKCEIDVGVRMYEELEHVS